MSDWPSTDSSDLLVRFGSERTMGENMARLRRERGWSQERLAEAMTEAGCPMPQTAISRIERAGTPGAPSRGISVDEALGAARAFGVSLDELLLPAGSAAQATTLRLLREAQEAALTFHPADEAFASATLQLARIVDGDPEGMGRVVLAFLEQIVPVDEFAQEVTQRDYAMAKLRYRVHDYLAALRKVRP